MAIAFGQRLTLLAFGTQMARGLLLGADLDQTLWSALLFSPPFFVLGAYCGELARRIVEEQVDGEMRRRVEELTTPIEPSTATAGG